MILSSTRRRGGLSPMVIAILALVLAFVALVLALCRDQLQPGFALRNPFGDPLSKYDFETASGTVKSEMEIELNRDLRAILEHERRFPRKEARERAETLKVEEEVDYKRDDKKDKKSKGSGEFKILFVSFKSDGETRKEIYAMQKDSDNNQWKRDYGLTSFQVREKNKELADKMDKWKTNDERAPFPN